MGQSTHAHRQSSSHATATRRTPRDPFDEGTFAPVPSGLIRLATTARRDGTAGEPWLVMVWAVLNRLAGPAGSWRGTRSDLARECGTNDTNVKRTVRTLAEAGYLTVTVVAGEPSLYTPNRAPEGQEPETSGTQEPQPSTRGIYDPGSVGGRVTSDPGSGHMRPGVGSYATRVPPADQREHPPLRSGEGRELASERAREPIDTPNDRAGLPPAAASPLVTRLGEALYEAGLTVQVVRKPEQTAAVEQLVSTHGVPALVRHARAQYRRDRPAASMAAFLGGWQQLPQPRPKDGPLTRPGSDDDKPQRVATEDRSPEVTARLAQVRAQLASRRASETVGE